MDIEDCFTRKGAEDALKKYLPVTKERRWPIQDRIKLYQLSQKAWDSNSSGQDAFDAFDAICKKLRGWQVFRPGGPHWESPEIFSVLKELRDPQANSLRLSTLAEGRGHDYVLRCCMKLRDIKKLSSEDFPRMAVSKFLHFFRPDIFPIYDNAVIKNQALKTFRRQWLDFEPVLKVDNMRLNPGMAHYLKYTLWGAHLLAPCRDQVMQVFSQWLYKVEPNQDIPRDFVLALEAAAFEMILIGAR